MALYEHVFLARQDISSQQAEELVAHFKGILEERGGKAGARHSGASDRNVEIAHCVCRSRNAPMVAIT